MPKPRTHRKGIKAGEMGNFSLPMGKFRFSDMKR